MASPHVAGAAALYLQAHPSARVGDVGAALLNSADPVAARAGAGLELVVLQGAGLVDVDDAILATTTITPGKLSLRDSVGPGDARRTLTIANDGPRPVTYALSNVDAPGRHARQSPTNRPCRARRRSRSSSADGAQRDHRAPPRARHASTCASRRTPRCRRARSTAASSSSPPTDGAQPLRVPYAGYKGDYQAVPAMTPTAQGYPWLARKTGIALDAEFHVRPVYERAAAGASFTLAPRTFTMIPPLLPLTRPGADLPLVLVHLEQPRAAGPDRGLQRPPRRSASGEAFAADRLPRNAVRRPRRHAVGARHRAAAGRHRPSRAPARAAARRRVLRAGDRRAGARRTPDTGRDLDVADLPDRPSLDDTLMLALGAAERELELAPRADVELGEHLVQVVLDRARADEQARADLRVGEPVSREPRDLRLLRRQLACASRSRVCARSRRSRAARARPDPRTLGRPSRRTPRARRAGACGRRRRRRPRRSHSP